jgi:hypothetical protein
VGDEEACQGVVVGGGWPEGYSPRKPEAAAEEHLDGECRWDGPVRGLCQGGVGEHQQGVEKLGKGSRGAGRG